LRLVSKAQRYRKVKQQALGLIQLGPEATVLPKW